VCDERITIKLGIHVPIPRQRKISVVVVELALVSLARFFQVLELLLVHLGESWAHMQLNYSTCCQVPKCIIRCPYTCVKFCAMFVYVEGKGSYIL